MVKLVIDASVALSWVFADERTEKSAAFQQRVGVEGAVVPAIWKLEITNALLVGELKQRIRPQVADEYIDLLHEMPIVHEESPTVEKLHAVMTLGRFHKLTSYDASYVELAMRRGLPIATRDTAMQNAARKLGLEIIPA